MKTFSNRHRSNTIAITKLALASNISIADRTNERIFLSETLRNRLQFVISYITSSLEFIEKFALLDNKNEGIVYLHKKTIADLSNAELGYDTTQYIDPTIFGGRKNRNDLEYDDFKLFDFIEILLVFTKDSKRDDVRKRFIEVFENESFPVFIMDWMLIPTVENGLIGVAPLLKDKTIQEKIRTLYPYKVGGRTSLTPEAAARVSADVVQYIFSSKKGQKGTKTYAEQLVTKVARAWTTEDKVPELDKMLSELVKLSKDFNNAISDVRHTDKHTIQANTPGIYEVIFNINLSIAELVLTTAQDEFIEETNSESIKKAYLSKYGLIAGAGWFIEKKETIDLGEIPF